MAYAPEPTESRYAPWVTGFVISSIVLMVFTVLLSLTDGMVGKAFPFGVASLVVAVAAFATASVVKAHRAGAISAMVVGIIGFLVGLQSALLGTGQI
jgi:hypothetical protein